MRKNVNKFFLLIFSVCFTILLSEILLRIFWNPPYLNPIFKRNDLNWLEKGVSLNSFGYRDKEFSLKKNSGVYRIYVLGDSYTYGWYIDDVNKSYPKVLEKKLTSSFSQDKIEVVNGAKPGLNFSNYVEKFENEGVLFNPDLVIVGVNFLDFASKEYPPHFIKNKFINDLKLYQATFGRLERQRVAKNTFEEVRQTYTDGSGQLKKADELLAKLKSLTDSENSKLVVLIFPQFDPENPNRFYQYQNFHEKIRQLGQKHGIQIIDLWDSFSKVSDKKDLVLNPTDPHPSALADQLAGEFIYESLKNEISSPNQISIKIGRINIGSKLPDLKGIISVDPGWVFFDRKFNLGTQRLFLLHEGKRQVPYLEDILKTAKSFTHDGWVGAKIELNTKGGEEINIPLNLYGYQVVGVSKVTGFWRENGALNSRDLPISELDITKGGSLNIKIRKDSNFELYKVVLDVSVNQFDIENGEIVSIFYTKTYKELPTSDSFSINVDGKIGSLPKFSWGDKSTYFIWVNNKMQSVEIKKNDNSIEIVLPGVKNSNIELPVAQEAGFGILSPLIEYL